MGGDESADRLVRGVVDGWGGGANQETSVSLAADLVASGTRDDPHGDRLLLDQVGDATAGAGPRRSTTTVRLRDRPGCTVVQVECRSRCVASQVFPSGVR